MKKKFIYTAGLLLLALFCIAPLLYLVLRPSWSVYLAAFANDGTLSAISNTLLISMSVASLSLILGLPLAWVISRTDIPGAPRWRSLFSFPYAIPPYVGAIAWILLANPSSGFLNHLLPFQLNIYSFFGLVWVECSFLYTFVFLSCFSALERMDASLEEAARMTGASPLRVFIDITLPLLRPTLVNGFILVFLATAASFGVPALIGGPARIYLLTTQIYTFQRMGTLNSLEMAIAISVILMITSLVGLALSQMLLRNSRYAIVTGKSARASKISLGRWRSLTQGTLTALSTVLLILPLLALVLSAFSHVQGVITFANLSFANIERILFETAETPRAVVHSFALAGAVALICMIFSFFMSYFHIKSRSRGSSLANVMASVPFATPGTVIAIALIVSFSRGFWGVGPSMYNTLFLIGLAYIIKYISLAMKTLDEGYGQIHTSLEEAARVSGASWWQSLWHVYWPVLQPSLWAAGFLVFMPSLSELTMSILLTGPGIETIGTLIFQLQEYADVGGGGASVLSLLIVVTLLALNQILKKLSQGRYGL